MTSREDVHRLLDAMPAVRLPALEQVLRASIEGPVPAAPRRFASTGALRAEHDLAERCEDRDDHHENSMRVATSPTFETEETAFFGWKQMTDQ